MSEKRRALGRGLGALIPNAPVPTGNSRPVDVFFPDQRDPGRRATAVRAGDVDRAGAHRRRDRSPATADATATGRGRRRPPATADDADAASTRTPGWPRCPARPSATSRSTRSGPTRASPAPSSTRTTWPSWSTRSARSGCSSRSSSGPSCRSGTDADTPEGVGYELIMGERRWRASQEAGQDDGARRSSRRPTTTTCCATPCWRTCTAASSTRSRRPRHTSSSSRTSAAPTTSWPPASAARGRRSPTRCGCCGCPRWWPDGSPPASCRPGTPGPCWPSTTARRWSGWPSGSSPRACRCASVEEIVALGGDQDEVAKPRRPRAGSRHPQLDDLAARLSDRFDTRVDDRPRSAQGQAHRGVRLGGGPQPDRRPARRRPARLTTGRRETAPADRE